MDTSVDYMNNSGFIPWESTTDSSTLLLDRNVSENKRTKTTTASANVIIKNNINNTNNINC